MKEYTDPNPLERDFQSWLIKYAKRRGWLAQKLVSQSANGWPDVLLLRAGRVILIEAKTPLGELSGNQRIRHREILAHGGEVYCFNHDDRVAVMRLLH